eukprot:TRINITY_DN16255_c0_g1::TRINITY_DN16255_c0_g1_i1::g.3152::m.3152 TRINITY_DN16255_c0_g1::TRINITY_DN16255_c0_g1_i1::g.3152  ORF type:complete len:401 (+),score=47.87,sp/Q5ZJJ8/UBCP1_CHICK/54.92/8e-103,NIF/PF03031.13/3.4e+03,NIF/PF03031.13/1.3e-23,ubiquitin/PF00240.18/2e-06 TRINITY_DN16255_c0_g1_i1:16-1218(+)
MREKTSADEESALIDLTVKWTNQEIHLVLDSDATVQDVKRKLEIETNVLTKRQKLIGFGPKMPEDHVAISALSLKSKKIMMMGTPEENLLSEPDSCDYDQTINDLDSPEEFVACMNRHENLQKINNRIKNYKLNILNPPRVGKHLLVLDVDYTLFDHRSVGSNFLELQRPYLHEFLTACYQYYDIVIWSATSMKWVHLKMKELGVLGNPQYRITALVDHAAMISVHTDKYGVVNCKPLGVLWGLLKPHYHEKNTICVDDLKRNFLMNPQNGLRIRPCRNLPLTMAQDRELQGLSQYLVLVAEMADFSELNHSHWEDYVAKRIRALTRAALSSTPVLITSVIPTTPTPTSTLSSSSSNDAASSSASTSGSNLTPSAQSNDATSEGSETANTTSQDTFNPSS